MMVKRHLKYLFIAKNCLTAKFDKTIYYTWIFKPQTWPATGTAFIRDTTAE